LQGTDGNLYIGVQTGRVFSLTTNGVFRWYAPYSYLEGGSVSLQRTDGDIICTSLFGLFTYDASIVSLTTNGMQNGFAGLSYLTNGAAARASGAPGGLAQDANGNIYGTASGEFLDASLGGGQVFKLIASPTILAAPADVMDLTQTPAQFSVSAIGAPIPGSETGAVPLLGYQWEKNGVILSDGGNISGSLSNKLYLSTVSAADAGGYSVVISNAYGSVTSAAAVLSLTNSFPTLLSNGTFRIPNPSLVSGRVAYPYALIASRDGFLYGSTFTGDIFKATTNGTLAWSVSVGGEIGSVASCLTQGADGNIYCSGGYSYSSVSTNGSVVLESSFIGSEPSGIVVGPDLKRYWTSYSPPGLIRCTQAEGATLWYLYFNGSNGSSPNSLIMGLDGTLYGTASEGGTNNDGTVFSLTTNGVLNWSFSFAGTNGLSPTGLTQGRDGNLYGTAGGDNSDPIVTNYGSVFCISTNGVLNWSVAFGNTNGQFPFPPLLQATDGNLYGATYVGGSSGWGTVFQLTTNGLLNPIYMFTGGADGGNPLSGPVQAADGNLYGVAKWAGPNSMGNLYSLDLGLPAPLSIKSQPQNQAAIVGSTVNFSVETVGLAVIAYQWYFSGAPLANQTNATLSLPAVTVADAGYYSVAVTSPNGSMTSATVTLLVGFAPAFTAPPQSQLAVIGNNATLSAGVSGTGPLSFQWQLDGTNLPTSIVTVAGDGVVGSSGDFGLATNASLDFPLGVALDALGNLYIADYYNNRIREVGTNGIITTVAGNGTNGYSGDGGVATNASLDFYNGVAVDGLKNLYIADYFNHRIREVGTNGIITTVAGGGTNGLGDGGAATNAELSAPSGVVVDASGNLFIADTGNNRIREVGTNGIITTVAGGGTNGLGDGGAATNAELFYPFAVAVDPSGNLFIADGSNYRIREVGTNGIITTVAGNGTNGYSGDDGAATNASLASPGGVAVDALGNLFIADSANNRIRKVDTNGLISTVVGNGLAGYAGDGGPPVAAEVSDPTGLALDSFGNLFIADSQNNRVREAAYQSETLILTSVSGATAGKYDLVLTTPFGSVTSSVATITVVLPPLTVILIPGTGVKFHLSATPNASYTLQMTTNLAPPILWSPLFTVAADSSGNWSCIDTNISSQARFYRAALP
jgi:uncharacterized repeat protein (TIGR03803 family)